MNKKIFSQFTSYFSVLLPTLKLGKSAHARGLSVGIGYVPSRPNQTPVSYCELILNIELKELVISLEAQHWRENSH